MAIPETPVERLHREVIEDLRACAAVRKADAKRFGAGARRCGEAMLYVLIAERAPSRFDDLRAQRPTLDQLIHQEIFEVGRGASVSADFIRAAEGVRDHGSALSHAQPIPIDLAWNARQLAGCLVKLVGEYHAIRGAEPSAEVIEALRAIADEGPSRIGEPASAQARHGTRHRAVHPLALAAGAALAGLVAGAALRPHFTRRPSPAATVPAAPTNATAPIVEDVPFTSLALVDAAVTHDAPAPVGACPEGSVAVPPMRFHLRAVPTEDRPTWPGLQRAPSPTERSVDGFCLQRRPLTRAEVARLDPAIPTAFPGCRRGDPAPHAPLGCLLRAEAARLCARWAPGGRLPTSLEWEAIVRAGAESPALWVVPWRSASTVPDSLEWTADPFPAPWLARGDARPDDWTTRGPIPPSPRGGDHAWNSWNHHAEGRVHNLYVRCALSR